MDTNNQNSIWVNNPQLKTLLLVLIFVFLGSGIGLVVFAQWQNQYRQQVYNDTQAGLPKHQSTSPSTSLGTTADIGSWKTYRNERYGFEFQYPSSYCIRIGNKNDDLPYPDTYPNSILIFSLCPPADSTGMYSHFLGIYWETYNGTVQNYIKNVDKSIKDAQITKEIQLNGTTAYRVDIVCDAPCLGSSNVYTKNDKTDVIYTFNNREDEILNKVLPTFRLIK